MQSLKQILEEIKGFREEREEESAVITAAVMDEHDAKWLKAKKYTHDLPNNYEQVLIDNKAKVRKRNIRGGTCNEVTLFKKEGIEVELSVQVNNEVTKVKPFYYAWDHIKSRCYLRNLADPVI